MRHDTLLPLPTAPAPDDGFPLDSDLCAMTDDGGPHDPYPARHEERRSVHDRPVGDSPVEGDHWQDRYDLAESGRATPAVRYPRAEDGGPYAPDRVHPDLDGGGRVRAGGSQERRLRGRYSTDNLGEYDT